jgi:hypothetical protein
MQFETEVEIDKNTNYYHQESAKVVYLLYLLQLLNNHEDNVVTMCYALTQRGAGNTGADCHEGARLVIWAGG